MERFADELDLRDATVVVQDWGGPIGLRLAVERPDRIARLVILNTEELGLAGLLRRSGCDSVTESAESIQTSSPATQARY